MQVWVLRPNMNTSSGVREMESPIYLQNDSILSMLKKAAEIIQKNGGVTEKAKQEYATWVNGNAELTGGEKAYHFLDEQGYIYRGVSLRAPEPRTDPKFFIPLIHPVTKKPCPVPPNGFSRTQKRSMQW